MKERKISIPSLLEAQESLELIIKSLNREYGRTFGSDMELIYMSIAHSSQANSYIKSVIMNKGLKFFPPEI